MSHKRENSTLPSSIFTCELLLVEFDETYISYGLIKVPHSKFPVAFFFMALTNFSIFFLADTKKRSARTGTLKFRSDAEVFHMLFGLNYNITRIIA